MTQPTHDEVMALVKKAKMIIENWIKYWRLADNFAQNLDGNVERTQSSLNCWLAHQSFFERHREYKSNIDGNAVCSTCMDGEEFPELYPCPESVTTADVIVNGVPE